MTLAYNDAEAKWSPVKLRKFDTSKGEEGEYVDYTLAEDEELNVESLNGLKTALDDLQIVDVVRKPQGLSNDLKAGDDFMKNDEALLDLMLKGFTAVGEGDSREIISSDGEIVATMKNGTEYVLRFGNLTNVGGGEQQEDAAKNAQPADAAGEKKGDNDVHRYLFVMARFDEAAVKQPELQQLPELPAGDEAKPAEAAENSAEPAPPTGDETSVPPATEPTGEVAARDAESTADEAKDAAETNPAAADAGEKKEDAVAPPETEKDKELEKIIAERQQIEQENQRKLDEYQETLKKGRESVKDLNLRFGDWYFVIDDEVFQKIRLSSDDVIKKKEKPKAEGEAADGSTTPAPPGAAPAGLPEIPGVTE
jgi:hypothetical protein